MTTHNPPPGWNGAAPGTRKFPPPPPPTPPFAPTYTSVNPMYTGGNLVHTGAKQPPNYMVLSIVALLCSLLFGAIGLYFSSQVTTRWNSGDVAGAQKASNVTLAIDIVGIVIGVFFLLAAFSGY